jgi:hypothetical protein
MKTKVIPWVACPAKNSSHKKIPIKIENVLPRRLSCCASIKHFK